MALLLFSSTLCAQSAPGGISNGLNYWLKADTGVSLTQGRVSAWANQTASSGSITQGNISRQPSLTVNALNFNPAVSFNNTNNDFDFLSTDDPAWSSDTVILVFNPSQDLGNGVPLQVVLAYNIPNNVFGDAGIGIGSITNNTHNFFNSSDVSPNQAGEYIATSRVSANTTGDSVLAVVRQDKLTNPTQSQLRFWGQAATTDVINLNQFAGHQGTEFTIGRRDGGGLNYNGDVLEAISYSVRLNDNALQQIESYLAIKYGLTLNQNAGHDYIDSSGNTVYDANGTLASYAFNITGIGRDDASGLNQKQARSTTTNSVQTSNSGLITMGLGTIAATNQLNTNTFDNDQSFLLWGNNAASLSFVIPTTIDSSQLNRMQRIWAVRETGNVGAVSLRIPQSVFASNLTPAIIVSSDSVFDSPDRIIELQNDGNNNYTADVDFTDGEFFSFGLLQAPRPTLPSDDTPSFLITPLPNGKAVIYQF